MARLKSKRGMEFYTLISILLLLVSFGLLAYVFAVKTKQIDEDIQELLCRGFNGLIMNIELEIPGPNLIKLKAPKACNTIHRIGKNSIPSDKYLKMFGYDYKEAAMGEIRDKLARCWWMWLDGREPNMFDNPSYNFDTPGFTCYTFTLNKKAGTIQLGEFQEKMDEPYYAVAKEPCEIKGGGGGFGGAGASGEFEQKERDKCLAQLKKKPECVRKGGECRSVCYEDEKPFSKWDCPRDEEFNTCCLKAGQMSSYLDYIQGSGGADTGPGYLMYRIGPNKQPTQDELLIEFTQFKPGQRYAISFVSPGKQFGLDHLKWAAGAVGGGIIIAKSAAVGAAVGTVIPIVGTIAGTVVGAAGGAIAVYSGIAFLREGNVRDINFMMLTNYDIVEGKYAETTVDKEAG